MRASIKRALQAGVLVLALAAGGPATFAAPQTPSTATVLIGSNGGPMQHGPMRPGGGMHRPGWHRGVMIQAAARYLGLTPSELRAQLKSGKTLAQIASSQGKSVLGLRQAMLAEVKARLDRAVANGKLTHAEAQTILSRAQQHIGQVINGTMRPGGGGGGGG
jgi:hypothetical protein